MKLILKENPEVGLTVTVEYPHQSSQLLSSYTTEVNILIRYANMVFFAIVILYVVFSKKFRNEVKNVTAMI